jgi:hypothetical protein
MKKIVLIISMILLQLVLSSSALALTSSSMSVSTSIGVTYPSWWDCREIPPSPAVWKWNDCYHVECKWDGSTTVTQVITEFAGKNYTATSLGNNKFNTKVCNIPKVGNYSWKQYARNIGGSWNVSAVRVYEIVNPCNPNDRNCNLIQEAGVGTGMFLDFINVPLFNILVILGVAFSVFAFVYYIGGVVYKPEENAYA